MSKWVFNATGSTQTWVGQEILASAYYNIPSLEEAEWAADDTLMTAIGNQDAKICSGNSMAGQMGISAGLDYLKGFSTVMTQSLLSQCDIVKNDIGCFFTVAAGTTHEEYVPVTFTYLHGGKMDMANQKFGDLYTTAIVDKDNVLGYGAGFVMSQYKTGCPIPNSGILEEKGGALSGALPSGVYIRFTYVSTGTVDVDCGLTLYGYDDA